MKSVFPDVHSEKPGSGSERCLIGLHATVLWKSMVAGNVPRGPVEKIGGCLDPDRAVGWNRVAEFKLTVLDRVGEDGEDRKSTRLNSSH